ncbi:hypothetical protein F4804DRAFT_353305 [Jackrogersella minutella]|nr:hypothetical protein F4804DRAFT_353305 [Jackrogersella minutella]
MRQQARSNSKFYVHKHHRALITKDDLREALEDHWGWYEWQERGSPHNHGLYWFRGAPEPDMETPESRDRFAKLWGYHVTAVNPMPETIGHGGGGNPLSVDPLEAGFTWEWLNSIVNRCQRHHCNSQYCLRVNTRKLAAAREKGEPGFESECSFQFPHEPRQAPRMELKLGRTWYRFEPQRNDEFLNQFNHLMSLCWLANIDISPCNCVQAVIDYAAKYCSKGKARSKTFAEIAKAILPHIAANNPMLSFVSKLMNKLVGERDYSAQEICHYLLGLPLQEDSRVVRSVDCRPPDKHSRMLDIDNEGEIDENTSPYEKYLQRPPGMEQMSYFEFVEVWNFSARNPERWSLWKPPACPCVLLYFPWYKTSRSHKQFSDFCWLLEVDGVRYEDYTSAFLTCHRRHEHPDDHYGEMVEGEPPSDPEAGEDEFEPRDKEAGDITLEDWHEAARLVPELEAQQEPANLLGRQDIDIDYDWAAHVDRYRPELFGTGNY